MDYLSAAHHPLYPLGVTSSGPHIGTLNETHLHHAVKQWYAGVGDLVEETIDGYVVDLVRGGTLVEIQTRSFSKMKRKLAALLPEHHIRIVHPIAARRWIVKGPHDGRPATRRKSPKRGEPTDVFSELVAFPTLLAEPNLTLEILMIDEEEIREFDGVKGWRRNGWVVVGRRLVEVHGAIHLDDPRDLLGLLPAGLAPVWTTADLATALDRPRRIAQQMAYCLRELGLIEITGKAGNALEYRVASAPTPTSG